VVSSDPAPCLALARRVRAAGVLDGPARETVGRRVFDTLGALAAGRGLRPLGALPAEGLLGEVRALCAATRCTELDDIDRPTCTTPGSVAVPVALAVAAARGAETDEVSAGIAAGYEAMVCLGAAIDGPARLRHGIWPSYLAAPVAAAATAAAVLGLDEERAAHALAIAMTRTAGAAGRIAGAPTSRWLTFGSAAADGVLSALAAEAGMLGDLNARPAAAGEAYDPTHFAPAAGGARHVERVDVKPYCTAGQTQAAIEAAQRAHAELGHAALAAIEVAVPEAYRAMLDQPEPRGRLASIAGAQFQIAVALTEPHRLFDVAREDITPSPATAALMSVIAVVADEQLSSLYPQTWPARVRLRAADGREATGEVHHPEGSAAGHALGWAALDAKHARVGAWSDGPRAEALAACRALADGGPNDPEHLLTLTTRPQEAVR
jgi:2-methylcitrate dehydratase PrpD